MVSCAMHVVLVTGAAGAIGRAIAARFAQGGDARLCLVDRDAIALRDVAQGLGGDAAGVLTQAVDLRDAAAIRDACATLQHACGAIDVLVNNAAVGSVHAADGYPASDWSDTLAVNLDAPFHLVQAVLPGMKASGWGRIVNVSSINAIRAGAGRLAYGTSKTALLGFTRQLAIETARFGITVNAVAPGAIGSPMLGRMNAGDAQAQGGLLAAIPMRRFGLPAEVADAVHFLASDSASYITGQALAIDGGFLAAGILPRD